MKVCVVSEGTYPITLGGLSAWIHLLMKHMDDVEFDVISISSTENPEIVYERLPNVKNIIIKPIHRANPPRKYHLPGDSSKDLAFLLSNSLYGYPINVEGMVEMATKYRIGKRWLNSEDFWNSVVTYYGDNLAGKEFLEYFWTNTSYYTSLLDAMSYIPELPDADIYHALSSGMAGFTASLAKAAHKRPFVLTEQGLYLVERHDELSRLPLAEFAKQQIIRFSEVLVKTAYNTADCIVPPCYNHVRIEKELGADVRKIKVISNGIEVENFVPGPPREGGRLLIGSSARVVPIKGIHILIQAAKLVREQFDADFVVFGNFQDKEYTERCFRMVEESGLKDHFIFTGHVANPLEWYQKLDIMVLASLSEGVPYALLEAMCCRLPCVCTAVGGVPEILPDESVGFVVPPNNAEKMAEKLCLLLRDKDLRRSVGEKAEIRAREKYNISEMADEFRHLYEGMINGSSRN